MTAPAADIRPPALETAPLAVSGVRHGFFTRKGGVSGGDYASLNCGFGSRDRGEDVAENRRRVAHALGVAADALVTAYQVHSADVVAVGAPWAQGAAPRADGLVCDRPGIALGVLAADCAPVLFADAEAGVIGACHAGWRGALSGVAEATVRAMEALGAARGRIGAAIGPCIAQASYEVGPELRERFLAADPESGAWFAAPADGARPRFDLAGYLRHRLEGAGIASVAAIGRDTYAEADALFSYRRACHRGEPDFGRLISAIALTG